MCLFTSFPTLPYLCSYANFRAFFLGAILVHARHRETIDVLNESPPFGLDCGLGYCCICGIWLLFRGEGGLYFLFSIFLDLDPGIRGMQSLIRSKSAEVTGERGTAGAGPGRDLLYQTCTTCILT